MRFRFARLGLAATLLGLLVVALPMTTHAVSVPPKPTDVPIIDQTNTLTAEQTATLASLIADERKESGNQIAIVIIPTVDDQAIEDYSLLVAREWGIGTSENNNGVLLLIAKNDRRLRIEVGTGLEGALTDVQTGRIIRNDIAPLFKQEKYYEGIQAGLRGIITSIHGEYTATASTPKANGFPWEFAFIAIIMGLSWLGSILARTKSWWAGGVIGGIAGGGAGLLLGSLTIGLLSAGILVVIGLLFDKTVSANYRSHASRGVTPSWWAGGGYLGGGGSDDGFGGFGGGSFGGGGSSGSW